MMRRETMNMVGSLVHRLYVYEREELERYERAAEDALIAGSERYGYLLEASIAASEEMYRTLDVLFAEFGYQYCPDCSNITAPMDVVESDGGNWRCDLCDLEAMCDEQVQA